MNRLERSETVVRMAREFFRLDRGGFRDAEAERKCGKAYATAIEIVGCEVTPPETRCKHGVWLADHCYQCAAELERVHEGAVDVGSGTGEGGRRPGYD